MTRRRSELTGPQLVGLIVAALAIVIATASAIDARRRQDAPAPQVSVCPHVTGRMAAYLAEWCEGAR